MFGIVIEPRLVLDLATLDLHVVAGAVLGDVADRQFVTGIEPLDERLQCRRIDLPADIGLTLETGGAPTVAGNSAPGVGSSATRIGV